MTRIVLQPLIAPCQEDPRPEDRSPWPVSLSGRAREACHVERSRDTRPRGPWQFLGTVFVLLLLGGLQQGCRQPNSPARMAALDSLIRVADSMALRLDAIDTLPLLYMDSVFKTQRTELEACFSDTLQRDTGMVAGNFYRAMYKSLPRALGNREFRRSVEESRKKLKDLQRDASKGIWSEEEELAFYEQERLIMAELSHGITVIENSAATSMREWENGHVLVDSVLAARRAKSTGVRSHAPTAN